jgi:ABC-type bacteriocin/lantibiotic exporter with double-glycine peptidase domain
MLKTFFKYNQVIGMRSRSVMIILTLTFFSSISEAFGIGIFYPIFQYIQSEGNLSLLAADSVLWTKIVEVFVFLDLEVTLALLLVISSVFFITRQILMYIRVLYQARLTSYLQTKVRSEMFSKYLGADLPYQEILAVGGLTNIMIEEIPRAVSALGIPIKFLINLIMFVIYIVILFMISFEMTLLSLLVFILASLIPQRWIKKSRGVGNDLVNINTLLSKFIISRFKSPRLIRLSGSKDVEMKEFNSLVKEQHSHNVTASILTNRTDMVMEPVVVLMSLFFLYISYTLLSMSIEAIGLYMVISIRLLPIVKGLVESRQQIMAALGALDLMKDRSDEMAESHEKNDGILNFNGLFAKIRLKDIFYHYPNCSHNVINGSSLEINSGEITAIVGPSGSGKSTLIDLLPRLRVPQKGTIFIDENNINEFEMNDFRNKITYVSQNPQFFEGSISDHIKYGNPNISKHEIKEACKSAGASGFIEKLSDGYNSLVGDDAIKLSGGQRQRIDLARALASNAKILILDEPTSSLDIESSTNFNTVLLSIRDQKKQTIIIVSHDLFGVRNSDKIIVLNNGAVENIGSHDYLLDNNDWYSKAYMSNHK